MMNSITDNVLAMFGALGHGVSMWREGIIVGIIVLACVAFFRDLCRPDNLPALPPQQHPDPHGNRVADADEARLDGASWFDDGHSS